MKHTPLELCTELPDERQNLVVDVARKFGGRLEPSLDKDFVRHGVSIDALCDMAPNLEERREMHSTDASPPERRRNFRIPRGKTKGGTQGKQTTR